LGEISFLGHVITDGGIAVDPGRSRMCWTGSRLRQCQKFGVSWDWLGIIADSLRTSPKLLNLLLLEKGKDFKWTDACQDSFEELKKRLTTAPVLAMPDIHKNFDIYCDASRQGLGCVLMQEGRVIVMLRGS